jgi:hypothetical protein
VKIDGSTSGFDLGDIRWLLSMVENEPDSTLVHLSYSKYENQFEPGWAELRVSND